MKKVKSIIFRANLKGFGIVNYDSSEQRYMWNQLSGKEYVSHDNCMFAKKNWFKKENGDLDYKIKISADCLRHEIFKRDFESQSPNIANTPELLVATIACPASILRGYLFTEKELPIKKTSGISIIDAEQISNAVSSIETFSKSGKKTADENKSDNSFFKRETVGEIEYKTVGFLNFREMQFLSLSQIFDRLAINPDYYPFYKTLLATKLKSFDSDPKFYQLKDSEIRIPEYGVLFSEEDIVALTKEFFERLFVANIIKSKAYARLINLEYKFIYDCTKDTLENENNWISINSHEDINSIVFEPEIYFVEENAEAANKLLAEIAEAEKVKKEENKKEKEKKDAQKAKAKKDKIAKVESKTDE
jgi:hypothetical protein